MKRRVALTISILVVIVIGGLGSCNKSQAPKQAQKSLQSEQASATANRVSTEVPQPTRESVFTPVDTSQPTFQVTLDDIRLTYYQDIVRTPPKADHPMVALQKGLTNSLTNTADPARRASILLTLATMAAISLKGPDLKAERQYLSDAITSAGAAHFAEAEAAAHGKLAMVYECQGNLKAARAEIQSALGIHKQLNMNAETAIDLANWGVIEANNGNVKEGTRHLEEALMLARGSNSAVAIAFSLCNLGECYAMASGVNRDKERAEEIATELQNYQRLTIPLFSYYRQLSVGGLYEKALTNRHVLNNWVATYDPDKGTAPIPLGYIEAPYQLPWPKN